MVTRARAENGAPKADQATLVRMVALATLEPKEKEVHQAFPDATVILGETVSPD